MICCTRALRPELDIDCALYWSKLDVIELPEEGHLQEGPLVWRLLTIVLPRLIDRLAPTLAILIIEELSHTLEARIIEITSALAHPDDQAFAVVFIEDLSGAPSHITEVCAREKLGELELLVPGERTLCRVDVEGCALAPGEDEQRRQWALADDLGVLLEPMRWREGRQVLGPTRQVPLAVLDHLGERFAPEPVEQSSRQQPPGFVRRVVL